MTNIRETWVVAADGAHARFLAVEPQPAAAAAGAVRLVERLQLANAEHTAAGRRAGRKIKSGRDTTRGSASPHGFADHRAAHEHELLRRFAAQIAREFSALHGAAAAPALVLVAAPRMLGLLRETLAPLVKAGAQVRELARDYTGCAPLEMQAHLAANRLL